MRDALRLNALLKQIAARHPEAPVDFLTAAIYSEGLMASEQRGLPTAEAMD
jgi:hypothetical protein